MDKDNPLGLTFKNEGFCITKRSSKYPKQPSDEALNPVQKQMMDTVKAALLGIGGYRNKGEPKR